MSALLLDEHPPRPFGESCWINGCHRDRVEDGFLCALHAPQAVKRVVALPPFPDLLGRLRARHHERRLR